MSTKKNPNPFAKAKTAVGRCVHLRDERDAALKTAAAALTQLEAMVDSDTATQVDIDAVEVEFEKKVDAFVELDKTLSAACDSVLVESHLAVLTVTEPKNMAKA
jgi:hypothetical protein